jgi:hypothetical protein
MRRVIRHRVIPVAAIKEKHSPTILNRLKTKYLRHYLHGANMQRGDQLSSSWPELPGAARAPVAFAMVQE